MMMESTTPLLAYHFAHGKGEFRTGSEDRARASGRRGVNVLRAAGAQGRGEDVRVYGRAPVGGTGVISRADGLREAGRVTGGGAGSVLRDGALCGLSERGGADGEGRSRGTAGPAGRGNAVREGPG